MAQSALVNLFKFGMLSEQTMKHEEIMITRDVFQNHISHFKKT
jgi:hypothetical protein